MDFSNLFKIGNAYRTFTMNHPKVPEFLNNVKNKQMTEGTEIAIAIRYPDGTEYKAGVRLHQSDLDLVEDLKDLGQDY